MSRLPASSKRIHQIRRKLMALRRIIFDTAAATDGVGKLKETLKWGEPAYVTAEIGSGSTIRIDWKKAKPKQYAMYFNCQTSLVESFRTAFPSELNFEGNRAIVFDEDEVIPVQALELCIAASFTYHRRAKSKPRSLLA
jgi:hypothetical protein